MLLVKLVNGDVPQAPVLSFLFSLLFIDDLSIKICSVYSYVDDITLHCDIYLYTKIHAEKFT